jgi:hypothetical protein
MREFRYQHPAKFSVFQEETAMATFALRTVQYWTAIAVLMYAGMAPAQEERGQPKQGNADKSQLVVGDAYVVDVGQGNVTQKQGGCLLKVTDDWLVFGQRALVAEMTGIPWLGELPYVGELFRKVKTREEAIVVWIPRAVATIESRTAVANNPDLAVFNGNELKIENCMLVLTMRDGKQEQLWASDISVRDGVLHFNATDRGATAASAHDIPFGDVLAVEQPHAEKPAVRTANARRATKQ